MTDAQIMHKVAFDITRAWFLSLNPDMEIDEDAYKEFDQQGTCNHCSIHLHRECSRTPFTTVICVLIDRIANISFCASPEKPWPAKHPPTPGNERRDREA